MSNVKNFRFKKAELGIFKDSAVSAVSGLSKDSRIMGLTRGQFSLIDLIHAILKKVGPSEVHCVTWSAGIKDAHNVKWLIDSNLISLFTLITDHSYKTRQSKYAASIEDIFGIENIRTSEIHAKFVLIKNAEYAITIRTSMNLNANKTCESFEIDENDDIYKFYYDFVDFVNTHQTPGFVSSSQKVNKTLDMFFGNTTNANNNWSDL